MLRHGAASSSELVRPSLVPPPSELATTSSADRWELELLHGSLPQRSAWALAPPRPQGERGRRERRKAPASPQLGRVANLLPQGLA